MRPGPYTPVRPDRWPGYSGRRCRRCRATPAGRPAAVRARRGEGYGAMAELRSVVLAGGGTGGHIYPLLAFADCLRRHDPDLRITCVGTRQGAGERAHPAARVRPAPGARPTSCPARSTWTWSARRTGCWRSPEAGRAVLDDVDADVVVGLRRLRRRAGLPGRLAPAHADRDPRGERAARGGQPDGHALHQATSRSASRTSRAGRRRCRTPGSPGYRCARRSPRWTGRPAGAGGPGSTSGSTRTGRPCSSSAPPRAPARSTWRWPARPRR